MLCAGTNSFMAGSPSRRHSRGAKFRRMLNRFDDFDVAGTAANVAAERVPDLILVRTGIAPQQAGGRHDEARRAIAALGAEFFVEAALHGGQAAVGAERLDGVDAP